MYISSVGKLRLMNREKKMVRYYDDMGPGKGNCTMGYGHLIHKKPCTTAELTRKVAEEDVMQSFDADVRTAENAVNRGVKAALTQEQFDALVSYTFNKGAKGAHEVYKLINEGNPEGAANVMCSHHSVPVKNKKGKWVAVSAGGLVSRRTEESAPFRRAAAELARSASK
jgi:lysozyme